MAENNIYDDEISNIEIVNGSNVIHQHPIEIDNKEISKENDNNCC